MGVGKKRREFRKHKEERENTERIHANKIGMGKVDSFGKR